jgi:hypothetical protein
MDVAEVPSVRKGRVLNGLREESRSDSDLVWVGLHNEGKRLLVVGCWQLTICGVPHDLRSMSVYHLKPTAGRVLSSFSTIKGREA